ncbi:MAG: SDR family oxidoreductase [Planctomycetota bacterium]
MRCLVTGGAGFIGSHLVDRLLGGDHEVVVLDNFSTGRRQNLLQQGSHPGLTIHEGDVALLKAIQPLFEGVDWVFHLAALADIVPSIVRPLEYYRSNLDGTVVVLEASRQAGVKRFIYAASSSCYGIPDIYPTPETAPISPQYPYALTKYLGEECVLHCGKIYKLPVLSLRFFNVYGPRSRTSGTYGAVFGIFLAQKLKGKPFTVVGDGNQTRDFTFVTDVVEAVVMAAGSERAGLVLNVGSGKAYSVNYLVELLGGDVVYIPERPGEPRCTQADITRIKSLLGWNPKVTFEKGVKVLLENIDYWREAPVWTPETISEATREWFEYLSK